METRSMNKLITSLILFFAGVTLPGLAHAEVRSATTIYVHGWTPADRQLSQCNDQQTCKYWKESLDGKTVHVGWGSATEIWYEQPVQTAKGIFDKYCRASSCSIICHSTGCPITAKALDVYGTEYVGSTVYQQTCGNQYGTTTALVSSCPNYAPGVPCTCRAISTTSTIRRWKIDRVLALGSAEGGSELGAGVSVDLLLKVYGYDTGYSMTRAYLLPDTVRAQYDHHDTAGVPFFMVAGYNGSAASAVLPGQDDGVVAYHSACAYSKVFSATQCSSDWEWVYKGWGVYVMREVSQWTNHRRVEYCGREGCNQTHTSLMSAEFQNLVRADVP
jgi:hypothetical protein